jgi:Leucine-rich repeat (LRR) protein
MNLGYVILHGKEIFIRDNALRLKDKGIRNILELKGLEIQSYLEVLNLIDNKISDIIGLEKLTNLKHLDLSYNQIKEIKGLENLTGLNYLNLDNNKIIEIKGLDNLANLQELKLSKNRIREIKGLDKLKNLKRIDLSHNEILDAERIFLDQEISVLLKYCLNKSVQQEDEKKFVESAKELYRKQKYQDSIR